VSTEGSRFFQHKQQNFGFSTMARDLTIALCPNGVKRDRVTNEDVDFDVENSPSARQKAKRVKESHERFNSMPVAVYPLIWDFLLDTSNRTVDFQSTVSFMLVSMTSKESFDACRGWGFCAQALKREHEAKRLQIHQFEVLRL
jgi:hypothetical protein